MKLHWKQHPIGTVKWLKKDDGRNKKYEYWIFLEKGKIPLKRHLWSVHVGEIPKNCVIRYKDNNPRKCILSNLECITRAQNVRINVGDVETMKKRVKAFFQTEKGKEIAKIRGEKKKNWWAKQAEEKRMQLNNISKKMWEEDPLNTFLSDKTVAYFLTKNKPEIRQDVLDNKDLIKLKRAQIKLNRLCKLSDTTAKTI